MITLSNKITITCIAIFLFIACFYSKNFWKDSREGGDGLGYYVYLPALFIHHDVGIYDKSLAALRKYNPDAPDFQTDIYGFRKTKIGLLANKYPIGVAILQSPFFFLGHAYSKYDPNYDADGFSRPYQISTFFSTLFYIIIGLWFLMKLLNKYYTPKVTNLTIFILTIGTNLLYFAYFGTAMSHGYQFAMVCLYLYFNDKYLEQNTLKNGILLGVSFGFVVIVRQQDLIFLLISLFWNVNSLASLKERFRFYFINFKNFLVPFLSFLFIISFQLYYYKFISGQFYYYSYVGESFNWLNPKILKGIFDTQNGWLLYTPIMSFAILSIFFKNEQKKIWLISFIFVMAIHIYISYSWWCWSYIAGFGSRPMVDIYPLCSFALASFLTWWLSSNKVLQFFIGLLLLFFTFQNLKFTYQQHNGIIHSQNNNKAYYRSMFYKIFPNKKDIVAYNTNCIQPDESNIGFVKNLYQNDFESDSINIDTINKISGLKSLNLDKEHIVLTSINLNNLGVKKGDWIKVTMDVCLFSDNISYYNLPKFILLYKKNGEGIGTWKDSKPIAFVENNENSIWYAGKPRSWGNVYYFVKVPFDVNDNIEIEVSTFNPEKVKWNIDNLKIDWFKKN